MAETETEHETVAGEPSADETQVAGEPSAHETQLAGEPSETQLAGEPPADETQLAGELSSEQRKLALRYITNALFSPSRRRLRSGNPYVALLTSTPAGLPLLRAAGFEEYGEYLEVSEASMWRLTRVEAALAAAELREGTAFLRLPDDLLVRCLVHLGAEDLSAWQRTCQGAGTAADGAQVLWLRLCGEGLRRGIRGLDAAQQARLPPAKQIYHLERVWSMLENRAGQQVRCSLRPGLAPHEAARRSGLGLPPQVLASLLIHDGQHSSTAAEGPGLLFDGARLLSADEIAEEAQRTPMEPGARPLTNLQGFKQLACKSDGSIELLSGFNVHVKARSWAGFLERTLVDTI